MDLLSKLNEKEQLEKKLNPEIYKDHIKEKTKESKKIAKIILLIVSILMFLSSVLTGLAINTLSTVVDTDSITKINNTIDKLPIDDPSEIIPTEFHFVNLIIKYEDVIMLSAFGIGILFILIIISLIKSLKKKNEQ